MRFRNYRNSFNRRNRIYSDEDILNMTLQNLFDNENDIIAQNREIGIPTLGELQNSENAVWVESYTRDDGTEVEGHWRSRPEGGNNNTEHISTNNKEKTTSNIESKQQDKKLYPEEIAGVKRGKPMSFEEASGEDINPDYYSDNPGNQNNCQSCVVAFEARRRGYDVQAVTQTGEGKINELSFGAFGAWLDKDTKEPCEGEVIESNNGKECYDFIDKEIKEGERYAFSYSTSRDPEYEKEAKGHIVVLDRNNEGKLRFYDPQSDNIREEHEIIEKFDALVDFSGNLPKPKILRIDNKEFNPYYLDEVVHKRH